MEDREFQKRVKKAEKFANDYVAKDKPKTESERLKALAESIKQGKFPIHQNY
jgi:hypothetical protein